MSEVDGEAEELPPLSAYDEDAGTFQKRGNGKGNGLGHSPPSAPAPAAAKALDWPILAPLSPPERQWAIKGWMGFGHVTLLVGPGGIGKTLIAQQAASCLALGRNFIETVSRSHRCLMWACEDDHDELWRRQVAISRWCRAGLEEFHEKLTIIPRHGLENTLVSTEFGRPMFSPRLQELSEQANDLHAEVVVLDNVGQLYGGSENDRHAVTVFLNALAGSLPGKAILLLAHPSRSMGSEFSGSSAWENVARTRLYFGATLPGSKQEGDSEQPLDNNVRYLSRRKANYSPKDWRRMTYADGALTPDEPQDTGGIIASIRAGQAEQAILSGIQRLATMGLYGTNGTRTANFLPKLLAEYSLDDGIAQAALTSAMRSLMLSDRIKRSPVSKDAARRPVFGLICS